MQVRIGNGYDVHRFADPVSEGVSANSHITIGGVQVPHDRTLLAHSDGDVLIHALCDALLGALALGDIGKHFPDTDPQYRGISSVQLLAQVITLVSHQGWQLINTDLTLVAEAPRFSPWIVPMRACLARTLQVAEDQVSVKATTTETLGFTGRREGIACYAVVLLGKA